MGEQVIISVSREFGSGGHEIAHEIAEALGIKMYDRTMLDEIAQQMNMDVGVLEKHDEKPRNYLMSRRVGKHSNSMEEIIAEMQFDYIRKKAESGESFVIVGRCAETVLRDYDNLITIFVIGDSDAKLARVMDKYHLEEKEAANKISRHDRKRKWYHNHHSFGKWGDSRYYDICINSSKLGVEKTAQILENYIRERVN